MRRGWRRRTLAATAGVAALLVTTAGCGFHGLYGADLPGSVGGPLSGDKTYDVTAWFYTDPGSVRGGVLGLVPQSSVRVNDVVVGTVEHISLDGSRDLPGSNPPQRVYAAKVDMRVKRSITLPRNTEAVLQETSLLGEEYVALVRPTQADMSRTLAQTHVITASTSDYPNAEQVFGVLATVLNGGGLEKLQTIDTQLAAALSGREDQVHDVLVQLNTFVTGLNGVRTQIAGAINALDTLSVQLNKQDATIAAALDDLGPGLQVLADQRANLVSLLQGLSNLGVITNKVVNASADATKADLMALEPVLTELNKAGTALPGSLDLLFTPTFPKNTTNGIHADGNNLILDINASSAIRDLCTAAPSALASACSQLQSALGQVTSVLGGKGQAVRPPGSLSNLLKGGAQ